MNGETGDTLGLSAGEWPPELARKFLGELLGDFPWGFLVFDDDDRVVAANSTFCEIAGYPAAELVGKSVHDLADEDERETARRLAELAAMGRHEGTVALKTGAGDVRVLRYIARTEVVPGRRVAFVRDVTDEEAQRHNLHLRAEALDALEVGVYVVGSTGRISLWNKAAERITGYSAAEAVGKPATALAIASDEEVRVIQRHVLTAVQRAPQPAGSRQVPIETSGLRRRADGSMYPSRIQITPLYDHEGRATGVLVMLHDLSSERERADNEGASRPTVAGAATLPLSVARQAIGGAAPEELLRQALHDLAQDLKAPLVAAWRVDHRTSRITLEAGHGWPDAAPREVELASPDAPRMLCESPFAFTGAAWANGSALGAAGVQSGVLAPIPSHGRSGQGALAAYTTDDRRFSPEEVEAVAAAAELIGAARARVRLERMEGALDLARRQASLGALISGVAHDFNNMLSVMLTYSNLMAEEAKGSELLAEGVAEIQAAAQQGMRLSRSLVDLGRQARTEPEPVEVVAVVEEVAELMHRVVGEVVKLETRVDADRVSVLMPPGELDRALVNLITNSRDAMPPEGGTVVIGVTVQPPDPTADYPESAPDGTVVIEVADDGAGMKPDVLAHAMDPSFTTKARGEGSGVGLTAVGSIVKAAGGVVELQSVQGEGTAARMILPITSAGS